MQSIYEKDVGKLWIILTIVIFLGITLIGYSYSYKLDDEAKEEYSLTTVYNSLYNTCRITNEQPKVDCYFTVMGFYNTNQVVSYDILISNLNNNEYIPYNVEIELERINDNYCKGPVTLNKFISDTILLDRINISLNDKNFFDEYVLKMYLREDSIVENSVLEEFDYKIDIKILEN